MSTDIGSLAIQITGSTTGLSVALKTADSENKRFEKRLGGSSGKSAGGNGGGIGSSMLSGLTSGIGAGLGAIGGLGIFEGAKGMAEVVGSAIVDSVKMAATFEDITTSLHTMTGSLSTAKSLMGQIQKFAVQTPFTTSQLAGNAQMLLGSGTEIDNIIPTLRVIGDMALGDATKMANLVRIYDQVRGTGQLTGREMNEFIFSGGIPVGDMLAKSMHKSRAEIVQLREEGKITTSDLQRAFVAATSAGGMFFEGTARGAKTFNGLISTLKDNWELFQGKIGQMMIDEFGLKEFVGKLSDGIGMAGDNLDSFRPLFHELAGLAEAVAKDLYNGGFAFATSMASAVDEMKYMAIFYDGFKQGFGDTMGFLLSGGVSMAMSHKGGGKEDFKVGSEAYGPTQRALKQLKEDMDRMLGLNGKLSNNAGGRLLEFNRAMAGASLLNQTMIGRNMLSGMDDEFKKHGQTLQAAFLANFGISFATQLHIGVRGMKIDPDLLNNDQRKQLEGIKSQVNPLGEMNKEFDNLATLFERLGTGQLIANMERTGGNPLGMGIAAALNLGNNAPLANQGMADIFQKFAGQFDQSTKFASIALKDSAEAVSAATHHAVGTNDPEQRVVNGIEAMRQMMEQMAKENAAIAKALADNKVILAPKPLGNN